jgi:predicted nucleic acid-binding protein
VDAFDADALIYAAVPEHPAGRRVAALFPVAAVGDADPPAGIGSLLLLPEVLGKSLRDGATEEVRVLTGLLARLDLRPVDLATAELAVALAACYRLRAADAVHLATAVAVGADRFITNNRRDFPVTISEIRITYPSDLPDPAEW